MDSTSVTSQQSPLNPPTSTKGVLASQEIRELIHKGHIKHADEKSIRPASLDLTITSEVYRLEEMFLPKSGETIRDILKNARPSAHHLSHPLERNVLYLARLQEHLSLPDGIHCVCNPKSSTGRVDIQVRVLADGVPRYDAVMPGGYDGDLWLLMSPKSFPVKIDAGESLSQIRFVRGSSRVTEEEIEETLTAHDLLWDIEGKPLRESGRLSDQDGSLILGIDVSRDLVGWECLGLHRILDLSKRGHYYAEEFFRPLRRTGDHIRLQNNGFYILYTRERVQVPPHLACEMVPMDERSGEFRVHYAGFIDPGWGWGIDGSANGRRLVLEIRPFEDIVLRDGQPVGKIKFEKMSSRPDQVYDQIDSNYINETELPRLSKHFRAA